MSKKKTNEEFVSEMNEINTNIIICSDYNGAYEKVLCKCKICGNEWSANPHDLLRGRGCPQCKTNKLVSICKVTDEEFQTRLNSVHGSNIVNTEPFDKMNEKILFKCNLDGYTWKQYPSTILSGHGCPMCANNAKITEDDFLSNVNKYNRNIKILSKYNGMHNSVRCKCIIDGYEWSTSACKIISPNPKNRTGCPQCGGQKRRTLKSFIYDLSIINPKIKILDTEFNRASDKIKCECIDCGHVWFARGTNLLSGYGCPNCKISKGEIKIKNYLDDADIYYEQQMKYDDLHGIGNGNLSYDFYIPSTNTLIEFQGKQHEKPIKFFGGIDQFKIQQEHDKRKRLYANDNNINLIEIWYYDYKNIEEILRSRLLKQSA